MKFIYIIFLVILNDMQCNVMLNNQTKSVDQAGLNGMSKKDNLEVNELNMKTVASDTNHMFLENVLYHLKNQNWTKEEEPCFNQTLHLLKGLHNYSLWAVWEWDSITFQPDGLLLGNLYQLGNFDECLGAPWSKTHPELQTKYCLTKVTLERTDKAMKRRFNEPFDPYSSTLDFIQDVPPHSRPLNVLTWGACVPVSCGPNSVQRLVGAILATSHLGTAEIIPRISVEGNCQRSDETYEFDGMFYAFVALVLFLATISIICSCWNCWQGKALSCSIINAFCLRRNAADLLKMKKDGLEVLYGIRFLSICLIVIDHQFGLVNPGALSNGRMIDKVVMTNPAAMLIIHDDLFVDTFFFLSGFLVTLKLITFEKFPNPFLIILMRYVRVVIGLALMIFFVLAALPHVGDGPLWPRMCVSETEACRQSWWLSLLMLGNYVNTEHLCVIVSWYIPCDFHFFVLTVLLFWLHTKAPRLAKVCGVVLAVASILVPGIINYYHDLPAVQFFTYESLSNPRVNEQFLLTYIKSHTRIAPYIVGIICGITFTYYKKRENFQRLSLKWSITGALLGLAVMIVIMTSGWTFLFGAHHPLENAVYAAINRPVWAAGLMMLVLCCALGHVPWVKGFLSWYPWVPLSRLSYGLYLTHSILILRNIFVTRNPGHFDYMQLLNEGVGVIFCGCIAAFIMWLLAEAPAHRLVTLLLTK